MLSVSKIKIDIIDSIMKKQNQLFRSEVPYAGHLTGGDGLELNTDYYLQYRIDDVLKIWGTALTDSMAFTQIIAINYEAARVWGEYTVEEMGHDRLFLADLEKHGITREDIKSRPILKSTQNILNYLKKNIVEVGPSAALIYSIYLEWNSEMDAAKTVELASKKFGPKFVKGSKAHLHIDEKDDHLEMVIKVLNAVTDDSSEVLITRLLEDYGRLFREYYTELYEVAIANKETCAVKNS